MAINKFTDKLRMFYRNLEQRPAKLPSVLYPSPTADLPEFTAERIPKLELFSKLDRVTGLQLRGPIDEDNERQGIYLARMQTTASIDVASARIVSVKFASRYNEAAHRPLADNDPPLAPALYRCTRIAGDLYTVVMECMLGASVLHQGSYVLCFTENTLSLVTSG